MVQVQEFDKVEGNERLYTVLLVNPDTPDLEKNSFSTTLHYALANVLLNNIDNTIDVSKLLNKGDKIVLKDYLPLTPEKIPRSKSLSLGVQTKERITAH